MLEPTINALNVLKNKQNEMRANIQSKGLAITVDERFPSMVDKVADITSVPSAAKGKIMLFISKEEIVIENLPQMPKEVSIAATDLFDEVIYGGENSYVVPSICVEFPDETTNEFDVGDCHVTRSNDGTVWRVELSYSEHNALGGTTIYFQGGKQYRWVVVQCITQL